jgi:hypothetical protein
MLAFIDITINIVALATLVLGSALAGFFVNRAQMRKHKSAISRLEMEMLQSHSEILQLQKELSDRDNLQSKTPIVSIKDSAAEALQEQLPGNRLSKKIAGGNGKASS